MLAAYVEQFNRDNPIAALQVGERPDPVIDSDDWTVVEVRATSINHHDVFTARGGVIPEEALPRILGMDAAGVDADGREVLVHNLVNSIGWVGPPLLDPGMTGLSEGYDGTFAERVLVPRANLVRKPSTLTFEEAACLPTAWLTAYRMLFVSADLRPGDRVLVQGAAGGVATALTALGSAAGFRMWVTGRDEAKRAHAQAHGAEETFEPGARLPERVDAVMETVGAPTWQHSLKCLRKGGTLVVAGGTGGYRAETDIARVFVNNLRIIGSTMGTREDLDRLVHFVAASGIRPKVQEVLPLTAAKEAMTLMNQGGLRGKIVLKP
ncbi:zinc-binding dehydrogenase [Rhodococcus erythropolis]|uniref:zinc-binding dehydrogenase n=1 Tax=Rhodococcus erythropolis TaxID=1833 RepID=UPI0024B77135|nr:zinc-binding dehydrogenase [Rhodococcus erythropolis]MDJ0015488.1 zinc-binding dehydrogenase [Rhodococcus erythropolis]